MSRDAGFLARWHLLNGHAVPEGPPLDYVLAALEPTLGPAPSATPSLPAPPLLDPEPVPDPAPAPPSIGPLKKVALVVGHNSRSPGAWLLPPVRLSEFAYYSHVTERLLAIAPQAAPEIEFRRFFRQPAANYAVEIDDAYRPVNAWAPDLVLELHFNGGGGNYAMMLVARGSERGVLAGKAVLSTMSAALAIPRWTGGSPTGIAQVVGADRGGRSVWAAAAPTVLTEPFFGDHSQHAERVGALGIDGMARLHIDASRAALTAIS